MNERIRANNPSYLVDNTSASVYIMLGKGTAGLIFQPRGRVTIRYFSIIIIFYVSSPHNLHAPDPQK